jgi:aspartate 1-decarboxylase
MQRWLLKSKLHRARVTGTDTDYEGSISIDADLLSAADIAVGERVQVVNVTNGERLETYTIAGDAGEVALNGAAARLAEIGDVVIVISYALCDEDERPVPTVLSLDEHNRVVERRNASGTETD